MKTSGVVPMIRAFILVAVLAAATVFGASSARAQPIDGVVQGGGGPIANATVTLWAAGQGAPRKLAETSTRDDGGFALAGVPQAADGAVLYLVAQGGQPKVGGGSGANDAIGLMATLGAKPPARVVVNELTTIASVWTAAQFLDGTAMSGHALGLKIAAGNVPNFVDLATGGWGEAIQGPLNSGETPTMANFATLADVLAGCVTRVTPDACSKLYAAATPSAGAAPTDTLTAAESIAKYPWYQPERVFALLEAFYPVPQGKTMRPAPYMPYLGFSPSAWVLPLKFDGGGFRAGGKAMFDSEGNLWVGNNFTVGWQGSDALWQGHATKFDPNGKPLSPITTGFAGGGMEGGTFGAAIDLQGNAWLTTYGSKAIAIFDKDGKPLTPPEGINFGGQLGLMQGIITAPNGDVWALSVSKRQLLYFPKGDWKNGRIVCEGDSAEPCKSFTAPFHLAIDQQDRIWVSDSTIHVIRFPASDPTKAVRFDVRSNNSGLNIDSQGNVWVTNRFGSGLLGMAHLVDMAVRLKASGVLSASDYLTKTMSEQKGGSGSVHPAATRWHAVSGLAVQGRRSPRSLGSGRGRQRQRVDQQFRDAGESYRAVVWSAHRKLSAWHEDWRPDLAARRLRGRRPADAD
jgi:sugar lactone lactonase YvrE